MASLSPLKSFNLELSLLVTLPLLLSFVLFWFLTQDNFGILFGLDNDKGNASVGVMGVEGMSSGDLGEGTVFDRFGWLHLFGLEAADSGEDSSNREERGGTHGKFVMSGVLVLAKLAHSGCTDEMMKK
jgi:hypothetical protein